MFAKSEVKCTIVLIAFPGSTFDLPREDPAIDLDPRDGADAW